MNVLLADDHPLFLEGLQNLLAACAIPVAGVAYDGLEALEKARLLHPDVILMDIRMPHCDGLMATRLIHAELPAIKIVMLTSSPAEDDLFEAIKSGACGYLLKTLQGAALAEYLSGLERGEMPVSREIAGKLLQEFAHRAESSAAAADMTSPAPPEPPAPLEANLTERQRQILNQVAQGASNKEIAGALYLSEATIKYHLGQIIQQLHLKNRAQVIAYALRAELTRAPLPE